MCRNSLSENTKLLRKTYELLMYVLDSFSTSYASIFC